MLLSSDSILITDKSLVTLFQRQKFIKRLDIRISNTSDVSLKSVVENCKQLECLNLSCMQRITDISLEQIGQQCKDLKEIKFIFLNGLRDARIAAISKHCRKLEKLTLGFFLTI